MTEYTDAIEDIIFYIVLFLVFVVIIYCIPFMLAVRRRQVAYRVVPWPVLVIAMYFFSVWAVYETRDEEVIAAIVYYFGLLMFVLYFLEYIRQAFEFELQNKWIFVVLVPLSVVASLIAFFSYTFDSLEWTARGITIALYASLWCKIPFILDTMDYNQIPQEVNFLFMLIASFGLAGGILAEDGITIGYESILLGITFITFSLFYTMKGLKIRNPNKYGEDFGAKVCEYEEAELYTTTPGGKTKKPPKPQKNSSKASSSLSQSKSNSSSPSKSRTTSKKSKSPTSQKTSSHQSSNHASSSHPSTSHKSKSHQSKSQHSKSHNSASQHSKSHHSKSHHSSSHH